MKTTLKILGIGFVMSLGTMFMTQAQSIYTGIGPAVAEGVSNARLPKDARKYISEHFKGVGIAKASKDFLSGEYEVKMDDGTELEFSKEGRIIEIDAPDGYVLSESMLYSILPDRAVEALRSLKSAQLVKNVEKTNTGYTAEIVSSDDMEYQFNHHGELVSVSYD